MKAVAVFALCVICCSGVYSAPKDSAQEMLKSELKEAFTPFDKQLRALFDETKQTAKSMSDNAQATSGALISSFRNVLEAVNQQDRSNMRSSINTAVQDLKNRIAENSRAFNEQVQRVMNSIESLGKALVSSATDASKSLENKYLTSDGQDLVRAIRAYTLDNYKEGLKALGVQLPHNSN